MSLFGGLEANLISKPGEKAGYCVAQPIVLIALHCISVKCIAKPSRPLFYILIPYILACLEKGPSLWKRDSRNRVVLHYHGIRQGLVEIN